VTPQLLIHTVVQETVVFLAQLATSGGVRTPLAQVADQVFAGLAQELRAQGITQNVIADMFGMALRTYHRRVQSAQQSQSVEGKTVWGAVLEYVQKEQPVSDPKIRDRFRHDDAEIVAGVLRDLTSSGLLYRAGRGEVAVYRSALSDFDTAGDATATDKLVWLLAYRTGPATSEQLARRAGVMPQVCDEALGRLMALGRVVSDTSEAEARFVSHNFEAMAGETSSWEVAVLDHFKAVLTAIRYKLRREGKHLARVGGSTWSLDVWAGHPLESRALDSLLRIRQELSSLRSEIDGFNARQSRPLEQLTRVVVYAGQYVAENIGQSEVALTENEETDE
jgi:hypothetical protein